jgi:hypothetical protein
MVIASNRVLLLKIKIELVLERGRFEHKKRGNMGRIVKGCYEKDKVGEKRLHNYTNSYEYTHLVFF